MQFEFATAGRIVFGPGTVSQAPSIAAGFGSRAFVATGSSAGRAGSLLEALAERGVSSTVLSVTGEPTMELVRAGTEQALSAGCDLVVAFGGGSVIDTGKAIAALVSNGGDPYDYAEVVGRGLPFTKPPIPFVAIPTTAGTGAEVTRNSVLAASEHHVKVSLRSLLLLSRVAIVDPELTYSLPPRVTANTGLDALTQVIEPFVSSKANPVTDGVCREGMARAGRALQRAYEHGDDRAAREDMSLVSLFGGLALANAGLGAAHGFAGPIGGAFHAPHGAICAAVLPHVIDVNVRALASRAPGSVALARYDEAARLLTGNPAARAADAVSWVRDLCAALEVPPLGTYGLTAGDIPDQVERAAVSSSMKGNPIALTNDELTEILARSI